MRNVQRAFLAAATALAASLVVSGCPSGPPIKQAPEGALLITIGFGAGSSGASSCTGAGVVGLRASDQIVASQPWSMAGVLSGPEAPVCRVVVTFPGLQPRTYQVFDAASGRSCSKTVVAGLNAMSIRIDAGNWLCQ
jgi:hypothetical protein